MNVSADGKLSSDHHKVGHGETAGNQIQVASNARISDLP
jgi:hypothetical protein